MLYHYVLTLCLKGDASTWFWSLSKSVRREAMHSWGTMHHKICEFFMNHSWLDKQKVRASTLR